MQNFPRAKYERKDVTRAVHRVSTSIYYRFPLTLDVD